MKDLRTLTRWIPCASALLACGSSGADGAAGEPGAAGTPGETGIVPTSLNQVSPRVGLLGRKLEVRLTFDGAKLGDKPTVKVGDLTVAKVIPDAGGLVVDLEIASTSAIGPRDVTVAAGGGTFVAKGAFVVAAPLDVKVARGKAEQGGLVQLDVANRDKIWFDTQNFVLVPSGGSAADAALVQLSTTGFTATDGSVFLVGDPLVKTGALGLMGINNPNDAKSAVYLSAPDAVSVGERVPETVTSGTPVQKTLASPLETAFFTATATPQANEGLLVDAHAGAPAGSTLSATILGYPASGRVSDLLDQKKDDPGFPGFIPPTEARIAFPIAGAAQKAFFVVVDGSLKNAATTRLAFDYKTYRAALVAEQGTPHETPPQDLGALPLLADTLPARIVEGEIKVAGEKDTYAFNGLAAGTVIDIQVSLASDAKVSAVVDTVDTFDSPDVIQVSLGGKVGSGATSGVMAASRFIQVSGAKGKYSLGIRRSN